MVRFRFPAAFSPLFSVLGSGCIAITLAVVPGCRPSTPPSPASEAAVAPVDTESLCERIDTVLTHARDGRRLNTTDHAAWQVVHGILAFGSDFPIEHDGASSPALDYLLSGGSLTGWTLRPTAFGVMAVLDPGSKTGQGHPDQWLGYLSQCAVDGMPLDTSISAGGKSHRVSDLLNQAKHDIKAGQEATWTLMAMSTYLPINATWTAGDGTEWTLEKIVAMEAAADLAESACGGSHRLYGLTVAMNRYLAMTGQDASQLTGGWADAEARIQEAIERARLYQQPDGTFSTNFFERPSTSPDVFARIGSTGHTFEFLAMALEQDRLHEPWITRAADALVTLLEQTADVPVECGGLYHAAHGLVLYRTRICGGAATSPSSDTVTDTSQSHLAPADLR
jgi:hypothetical protein